MAKVLMIGLGGTGIKTLVKIKQRLIESNPQGVIPPNVQFLGIDTLAEPEIVQGVYAPTALDYPEQLIRLNQAEFVNQPGYLDQFLLANRDNHLDWMDADWYREHPHSSALLTPEVAFGSYRQVGRLALMTMLENAENSPLYRKLSQKISALYRPNEPFFYLLVFGSLVGGTGASMVADIPYLVRHISGQQGMVPYSFGFFALPDAFRYLGGDWVDDRMRARALAALRELERFNLSNDEEIGYRMVYDAGGVLSFRTQGSAYSLMYLFDQRSENPLDTNIDYGVCATMASFAWMFTDEMHGNQLSWHLANRSAHLGQIAASYDGFIPPVCASFGTYSYVLPLGAMVESWAHRFAMEALETLVPRDTDTHLILTTRWGEEMVTAGGRSVKDVLTKELGGQNRAFIQDLTEIGLSVTGGNAKSYHQMKIDTRSVSEWIDVIRTPEPTNIQQDIFEDMLPENTYFCKVSSGLLGEKISVDQNALVPLQDPRNFGNSNGETAKFIIDNCEQAYNRKTDLWIKVTSEQVDAIFKVYAQWLLAKTAAVLNGTGWEDNFSRVIANKAGKLGWWWDFLGELVNGLEGLQQVLSRQKVNFSVEIEGRVKAAVGLYIGDVSLEQQLVEKASKKNQKKYLKYQQDLLDIMRKLILLQAELYLVEQICEYTRELLKQVTGYINAIYGDPEVNIYRSMQMSRERIDQSRHDAGRFNSVREVIYDPEWENKNFLETIRPDSMGIMPMWRVLADLNWKVAEVIDDTGATKPRDVPKLTLEVGGFDLHHQGYLRQNQIEFYREDLPQQEKKEVSTAAVARLVARCRKVFLPVWHQISVLDYLVDKWNGAAPQSPSDFAAQVSNKIGVLLDGLHHQPTMEHDVFCLYPSTNDASHKNWMTTMYQNLNTMVGGSPNMYAHIVHSDPSTFTVMSSVDFVDYHNIRFWGLGMEAYLRISAEKLAPPAFSRSLLHVMRAEQNAAQFEYERLLSPVIVSLFEDLELLSLFVDGLVWGFMKLQFLQDNSGVYCLELPPQPGEKDSLGRVITKPFSAYLIPPGKYVGGLIPPLTEAALTFCLRDRFFSGQNLTVADYHARLRLLIEQDITQRCLLQAKGADIPKGTEELRRLVVGQIYADWVAGTQEGFDTKLDQILAQFEAGVEFDFDQRLARFSKIEEEFLHQVVRKMIEERVSDS